MITILLIYLIGVIIAFIINYNLFIKKDDYITIRDSLMYLIISIGSWISIIVYIAESWEEILNYRIYDKNKNS